MATTQTAAGAELRAGGGRSDLRSTGWYQFEFVPHLFFGVVTLGSLLLLGPSAGLLAVAVTSCAFAITIALRQGGAYLLPSSIFFMASGVFVGGAAYYLGRVESIVAVEDLRIAGVLALLSTIGMSLVSTSILMTWRERWPHPKVARRATGAHSRQPRQWELRAIVMIVISQLPVAQGALGPIAPAFGVAGVLMIALSAASRRVRMRWKGDVLVVALVALAPIGWVLADYTGGGRIRVAGMFIAAFMGWNLIRPHRAQKVLVILSIPVFLFFAGQDRLGGDATTNTTSVVADGNGLASVYSPLETWGQLIEPKPPEDAARLGPRYGGTFFNTLVLPVPRQIWDAKPIGFGRELVEALQIQGVSEEHSEAALIQGEWYANFGYWGLGLMVPVMGWLMALLDRAHARLVTSRLQTPWSWWVAAALLAVVSSLADLYWVGTFTWFSRGGLAAVVTLVIGRLSVGRQPRMPYTSRTAGPAAEHRLTSDGRS